MEPLRVQSSGLAEEARRRAPLCLRLEESLQDSEDWERKWRKFGQESSTQMDKMAIRKRPQSGARREPKMAPLCAQLSAVLILAHMISVSAGGHLLPARDEQAAINTPANQSRLLPKRESQSQAEVEASLHSSEWREASGQEQPFGHSAVILGPNDKEQLQSERPTVMGDTQAQQPPSPRLQIVRLFAPEAVQNGTQNVTIDCMFRFDKKLDQRLTIKWFFNDDLEPIYQWIPELNKRVYSDKYEHLLDKSYQVNEDVDFMLQSYKWLLESGSSATLEAGPQLDWPAQSLSQSLARSNNQDNNNIPPALDQQQQQPSLTDQSLASLVGEQQMSGHRKLLANRLNRLAKLGSERSRQLLASLRSTLLMHDEQFSKFRALRLVRPGTQMGGKFTCSVSSLDAEDLQSTRLVVFEPAKRLEFMVTRVSTANEPTNRPKHPDKALYNLTCSASQVFPRPTLSLFRQLPDTDTNLASSGNSGSSSNGQPRQQQAELLAASVHTVVVASGGPQPRPAGAFGTEWPVGGDENEIVVAAGERGWHASAGSAQAGREFRAGLRWPPGGQSLQTSVHGSPIESHEQQLAANAGEPKVHYDIVAWTLVDESTLGNKQAAHFECLLTVDGAPNFQQRQQLALQKGWYASQSPVLAAARNSTLVGLLGASAALLCLLVALVSAGLIFRLLRGHPIGRARAKVAQAAQVTSAQRRSDDSGGSGGGTGRVSGARKPLSDAGSDSSCSATSTTNVSSRAADLATSSGPSPNTCALEAPPTTNRPGSDYNEFGLAPSGSLRASGQLQRPVASARQVGAGEQRPGGDNLMDSEQLYRVPVSHSSQALRRAQQQQLSATAADNGPVYDNGTLGGGQQSVAGGRFVIGASRWPTDYKQSQQLHFAPQRQSPLQPNGASQVHQNHAWNQIHNYAPTASQFQHQQPQQQQQQPHLTTNGHNQAKQRNPNVAYQATISVNGKQLYC